MTTAPAVPCVVLAGHAFGGALHAMRSAHAAGAEVHVAAAGGAASVYRRSRSCADAVDLLATEPEAMA
ncbi:MAG TPA: hypothetical protein VHK88_12980, partial [Aquihabitans sp.]|nr:hypothetical protein [Aquihabitans sp.]